jgi:hypothetical protein
MINPCDPSINSSYFLFGNVSVQEPQNIPKEEVRASQTRIWDATSTGDDYLPALPLNPVHILFQQGGYSPTSFAGYKGSLAALLPNDLEIAIRQASSFLLHKPSPCWLSWISGKRSINRISNLHSQQKEQDNPIRFSDKVRWTHN